MPERPTRAAACGALLAIAACVATAPTPRERPRFLMELPGPADSGQSWTFVRRRPGVDTVEQSFAEMHEREARVTGVAGRLSLAATTLPPFANVDTLIIDERTYAPVEEWSTAASLKFHYSYSGAHVTGSVQRRDSAARAIDATFESPVFVFNELERVVRGLSQRRGLTVVVPLFSEADGALEHDTLSVVDDTVAGNGPAWIIRFADPVIVTRYVVSAGSRALLEADTRQRRTGTLVRQTPTPTPRPLARPAAPSGG